MISILFLIPISSIGLLVFLIPAVSIKLISILLSLMVPSTISLVVPGTSVTIAFSSSNKVFRRLLFPTFVLPIIPTLIPVDKIFPSSDLIII